MPFMSELSISYEGLVALAVIGLVMFIRRRAQSRGAAAEPINLLDCELRCGVVTIPPGTKFGDS